MIRSNVLAVLALGAMCGGPAAFSGCSTTRHDVREVMLERARQQDSEFPDGMREDLTQFAYIGTVNTASGVMKVVSCRSVLTGMLAPRGKAWLAFFNGEHVFAGRITVDPSVPPLSCGGSRVYFYGSQSDGTTTGNALELASGIEHPRFLFAERIGSW